MSCQNFVLVYLAFEYVRHKLCVLNHKQYDFSKEFTHNNIFSCPVPIMNTSICAEFEYDSGG
jgi:hypothetical protein